MWIHTSGGMVNSDYVVRLVYRRDKKTYCVMADGQEYACDWDVEEQLEPLVPNTTNCFLIVSWYCESGEFVREEMPIVAWRDCGSSMHPVIADDCLGNSNAEWVVYDPATDYWTDPFNASGNGKEAALQHLKEACSEKVRVSA